MRRTPRFAALTACLLAAWACRQPATSEPPRSRHDDIPLALEARIFEAQVPNNSTLASLLAAHDVAAQAVQQIVEATTRVFDPRRLKARNLYRLEMGLDGVLRHFQYEIDTDRFLSVVGLGDVSAPRFIAEILPYPRQVGLVSVRGDITSEHSSLVAAMEATGETITLALGMADILSGEIDFNSELQPHDAFDVVFEKVFRNGEAVAYGDILAASFVNEGRTVQAFRFEVPGEKPGYYDAEGRSLKRLFLKSPLKFDARVTSGFSRRRMHPILGAYRPHLAVDYGAPYGAPVVAVSSGTVVSAGFTSGGGNMVRLRHSGGYESYYLHLSAFAPGVRAGAHVTQGDVLGRVGATGLATAPHLDYRLSRQGQFLNPIVEHANMPPGEPVPAASLESFFAVRDRALARLIGSN